MFRFFAALLFALAFAVPTMAEDTANPPQTAEQQTIGDLNLGTWG